MQDEEGVAEYYRETDIREREAKLKPADMPATHCPALVAESLQTDAERLLIDTSGEPFGVSTENMVRLDHWRKWIDLVVGFILNCTDYQPPELGRSTT